MTSPNYVFNEEKILEEIKNGIDSTYSSHYAQNKVQSTEFIADAGHGEGFCIGNIIKYAQRYGKKNGYNREDLKKIIHYAIIMMCLHDKRNEEFQSIINESQPQDKITEPNG